MPADLIAALIVGAFAGGFTWLLFKSRRRRAPRALIPFVVGAGILGYTIWNEYTWASRTIAAFPAQIEVVQQIPHSTPWQPWTYLFPRTDRLIAVNRAQLRHNDRFPGQVLVDLLLFERLLPVRHLLQVIDCPTARVADVVGNEPFLADGRPAVGAWAPLRRDDKLFAVVCGGTAPAPAPPVTTGGEGAN
jgi:hypothetical protein